MKLAFPHALHAAILVTGFVSFGYELALQAVAVTVIGSGQVAMAIVISMFILGYMTSRPFGRLADRLTFRQNLALFAGLEVLVALLLLAVVPLARASPAIAEALAYVPLVGRLDEYARIILVLCGIAFVAPAVMGGEIPVAVKAASQWQGRDAASRIGATAGGIWSADALGAAAGGLAAGLWLVPALGREGAMLLFAGLTLVGGALPIGAALLLRDRAGAPPPAAAPRRRPLLGRGAAVAVAALLLVGLVGGIYAHATSDRALRYEYEGRLVHHETSRYQEIVVTDHPTLGRTLYLDGQLQTSERDEHQYHEPLAYVPLAAHEAPRRVLVVGGGDGGALKAVLRDARVEAVDVVDLDPRVTAVTREYLPAVPGGAFEDPRARLHHADGWRFLRASEDGAFDVVLVDLPDPTSEAVALLYTREFYDTVRAKLAPGGIMVTQAGSPFQTPHVTASIRLTVEAAFGRAKLYETLVWSFGSWAFVVAERDGASVAATPPARAEAAYAALSSPPRWYRAAMFGGLFGLGEDPEVAAAEADARVSTVERPLIMNPWYQFHAQPAAFPRWLAFALPPLAVVAAGLIVLDRLRKEAPPRAS